MGSRAWSLDTRAEEAAREISEAGHPLEGEQVAATRLHGHLDPVRLAEVRAVHGDLVQVLGRPADPVEVQPRQPVASGRSWLNTWLSPLNR